MTLTPEYAALVAQVYPTLMIAILIEGRLRHVSFERRWLFMFDHLVRWAAVLGSIASTFICLAIVRQGAPGVFGEVGEVLVAATGLAIQCSFVLMTTLKYEEEQAVLSRLFKQARKSKQPPAE